MAKSAKKSRKAPKPVKAQKASKVKEVKKADRKKSAPQPEVVRVSRYSNQVSGFASTVFDLLISDHSDVLDKICAGVLEANQAELAKIDWDKVNLEDVLSGKPLRKTLLVALATIQERLAGEEEADDGEE